MPVALKPVLPADAIAALEARGKRLDPTFAWQEAYAEDHARAFTVAKSAGFDILRDIFDAIDASLKDGSTEREFAKLVTPTLQAKGWWGRRDVLNPQTGLTEEAQLGSPRRLRLIFDVNMRVSYAAGHWAHFERNRVARPFLRYVAIMDERTRPTHALHHNVCLPIDHPHWNIWSPPCGWACRCTLQSLSQRDVDAMRSVLKFEPPTIEALPWTNKVTGEVRHVPKGIDPGWDYNPGRAGYRGAINTAFAERVAAAPAELLDAGVAERLGSQEFRRFYQAPEGDMPVMVLADDVRRALGTEARAVALSADTMRKQLARHADLSIDDYLALPGVGRSPTLVVKDGARTIVLLKLDDGRWRYAAIKATKSGRAAFLTSFRFARPSAVDELLAKAAVQVVLDRRG